MVAPVQVAGVIMQEQAIDVVRDIEKSPELLILLWAIPVAQRDQAVKRVSGAGLQLTAVHDVIPLLAPAEIRSREALIGAFGEIVHAPVKPVEKEMNVAILRRCPAHGACRVVSFACFARLFPALPALVESVSYTRFTRWGSPMSTEHETHRPPKFLENSLLVFIGLLALAPLYYQLPRWRDGLDPTFVHPRLFEQSPFPLFLHIAAVHPLIWIALAVIVFIRLCRNYGWKLEK